MKYEKLTKKELILEIKRMKKEFDNVKPSFKESYIGEVSDDSVQGIISTKLKGSYIIAKYSVARFKKLLKAHELLFNGKDSFEMIWGDDIPLIIGRYDKETNIIGGFVLAPMHEED